ncbi:hypothetical protein SV7mr_02220 [Stieleria bergensis]|uniref:Uncharacterized protein n=1 Tax=Stieleria bergensis TaxID=2528025 RepID=A0A517SNN0_9BACT|nr:hypothetical protein SV7mr_02220 [Planctomycetes bacterium SV_7m_r]
MLLMLQESASSDDQATATSEEAAALSQEGAESVAQQAPEVVQEASAETVAMVEVVAPEVVDYSLNGAGIALMGISITTVICLLSFCLYRVLMTPASELD